MLLTKDLEVLMMAGDIRASTRLTPTMAAPAGIVIFLKMSFL
jgi:hypothetical protein